MNKIQKKKIILAVVFLGMMATTVLFFLFHDKEDEAQSHYDEIRYPTMNYSRNLVNDVEGIILHHTALPTIERSLDMLTLPKNIVSTHCVIDTDGTRYILADPGMVTFHAGKSVLNGRERCNEFTIGIEFQGNTVENPLTDDQIRSAVEYIIPVMRQYAIPLSNVVTHEMIRAAYMEKYPDDKRVKDKCDITQPEYHRVMEALRSAMGDE